MKIINNIFFDCQLSTPTDINVVDDFFSLVKRIRTINLNGITEITGSVFSMPNLESIDYLDFHDIETIGDDLFLNCLNLQNLNIVNWNLGDVINLKLLRYITPLSIHNIVKNAIGVEWRELRLHPEAYAAWEDSEFYFNDSAVASEKNIEIVPIS